ncbi:MAG: acetyl-CoA carboxylase biotin carboxyl carrier protein [Candidatus Pelagibacter sp.]|mgnify:FL=1|nr:acetyl-CoA carboxylase biotin carboxyl carrier protein [Candidatus Pelagibacter sp.]
MKINKDLIKTLSEYLEEFKLTSLSYKDGDISIKVGKEAKATAVASAPLAAAPKATVAANEPVTDPSLHLIKSPMVGTAYLAAEPGAKPFVTVGSKIKKGTTILIIEAMKTMNHIQATADGELKELCVKDGEAIEFDQILAKIK